MAGERKKRIAVLGASGYTGAELVRLLLRHPLVEIALLTADRRAGQEMRRVFPQFGPYALPQLVSLEQTNWKAAAADLVFCALPHGESQQTLPDLREEDIDFDAVREAKIFWVTGTGFSEEPSRSATMAGGAVTFSARELRRRIVDIAADLLEAAPEDLVVEDGLVHVRGTPAERIRRNPDPVAPWTSTGPAAPRRRGRRRRGRPRHVIGAPRAVRAVASACANTVC